MPNLTLIEGARQIVLPYSEVCCFMKVAGKEMTVTRVGERMAQLWNDDGTPFSFPITLGEAGWGRHGSDLTITTFDNNGRWWPKEAATA